MIKELLEHHILDHSLGISLFGYTLPITQHSVMMFIISVLLFVILVYAIEVILNIAVVTGVITFYCI